MSTSHVTIDPQRYGRLVAKARPSIIKTEEENQRMLAVVETLMRKGDQLSAEEGELLELLGKLIADFEEQFYKPENAAPHEVLQELMLARGLEASDLWELFGSKGRASEAINGKRAISKNQAKTLASYFNVPVDLFI